MCQVVSYTFIYMRRQRSFIAWKPNVRFKLCNNTSKHCIDEVTHYYSHVEKYHLISAKVEKVGIVYRKKKYISKMAYPQEGLASPTFLIGKHKSFKLEFTDRIYSYNKFSHT